MVGSELLDIMAEAAGGLLGSAHTWVGPVEPSGDAATPTGPSQDTTGGSESPAGVIRAAPRDAASLEAEILALVEGFVGSEVSVEKPLAAQGLDSLAAMELRQKLQVGLPTSYFFQFCCLPDTIVWGPALELPSQLI